MWRRRQGRLFTVEMRKINLILVVALAALTILLAACSQSPGPEAPAVPHSPAYLPGSLGSYTLNPQCSLEPEDWEDLYLFDEQGIVQVDYKGEIGIQYNPVTIAQYALASYEQYLLTQEDKHKTTFLTQAEYLMNNFDVIGEDMVGFPYLFFF